MNDLKLLTGLYSFLSKTLVGLFLTTFACLSDTLNISAALDLLLTRFFLLKKRFSFSEMIPLFVKKSLIVFQKFLFVIIPLDVIWVIYYFMLFFLVFTHLLRCCLYSSQFMEVWYNFSAHRSAHFLILEISSDSHIKLIQPQWSFLQYGCSLTMLISLRNICEGKFMY